MSSLKSTLSVWLFAITKVPLLFFCFPSLHALTNSYCAIRIGLTYFTKNHLNTMYFGALMMGADLAGGLLAFSLIKASKHPVSLVFKDVKASFLKRPDYGVTFHCNDGAIITDTLQKAIETKTRHHCPLTISATCNETNEEIATFILTLSLKHN